MTREAFRKVLEDHMETWGPNCGAPKKVYLGHLKVLIKAAMEYERQRCVEIIQGFDEDVRKLIWEYLERKHAKDGSASVGGDGPGPDQSQVHT